MIVSATPTKIANPGRLISWFDPYPIVEPLKIVERRCYIIGKIFAPQRVLLLKIYKFAADLRVP